MGIDIYLGGYERHKRVTAKHAAAFEETWKMRDRIPRDTPEHEAAQVIVDEHYAKMFAPETGYLRSSYNSSGLFNRLEEIFGIDAAALFFPGDWSQEKLPINADAFVQNAERLMAVAVRAVRPGVVLPLVEETAREFGRLPDPHPSRAGGEVFGASVGAMLSQAQIDGLVVETHAPEQPCFDVDIHGWYVTEGLRGLLAFGRAAQAMSRRSGTPAWVTISY